jgi:hypothetical protein
MKKEFPELRKQNHKRTDWSRKRPICGFDSETFMGTAILLCSDNECIEPTNIDEVLRFLSQRKYRRTYNFFYNIKFDFAAMMKYLPEELFRELTFTNSTEYEDYELYYIPGKIFNIKRNKEKTDFFDLTNFYEGTLDANMRQYLSYKKFKDIDANLINSSYGYYQRNRDKIIRYCMRDAEGAKGLGELLQEAYKNTMGIYPKSYLSKAFIGANYFRQECYVPSINKLDASMLRYWWEQYKGGRFEVYQKGFFNHVYDYDLTSAYPATIAELINIKVGKWKTVTEMSDDAFYGVYRCKVGVKKTNIPPIGVDIGGRIVFPIGNLGEVFLTKDELIHYKNVIEYEIKDGYEFYPSKLIYPFRDTINNLVQMKIDAKVKYGKLSMEYQMPKITMNSFYGKFLNINNGVAGKYWNIIYGALITADTKIKVWELARKAGKNLISIETDGIFTTVKLNERTGKQLGDWELMEADNMFIIGNGVFTNSSKLKSRGFPKKYLNFDKILKEYGNESKFKFNWNKPVTPKEAMIMHKYKIKDINVWNEAQRTVNCNSDIKRVWARYDYSFNELRENVVESSPLIMDLGGKK